MAIDGCVRGRVDSRENDGVGGGEKSRCEKL
jgi:hypothetical protein